MLAGFLLLTWGVIFIVAGAMVLWLGTVAEAISSLTLSAEAMDIVADLDKQPNAFAGIVIILGIMQAIGAIGILAHRAWGRAFGVVLGLLGTIAGIGMILSAIDVNVGDFAIRGTLANDQPVLGFAILVAICYVFIFLAMFAGKRHFRKKGVS